MAGRVTTGQNLLGVRLEVNMAGQLADIGAHIKTLDKKMATSVRKQIRTGVAAAAEPLAAAVRAEASWSSRIPGATTIKTSFGPRSAGAVVEVNKKKAPHARPLEMGSQRSSSGTLRHPVFADSSKSKDEWTWVSQPQRPFFFAAVDAQTPLITARMNKVLDDVAEEIGFTG